MNAISEGCVLLDAWQITAQGYQENLPVVPARAPFAPYQSANQADDSPAQEADGLDSQTAVEAPAPRRRRRKGKYQPNVREQEAAQRAEEAVPLLERAVASLQAWMAAQERTTLQARLA
jgi:hypothetical protein